MNIHLIAIGGSAMHNLALELHKKGYQVVRMTRFSNPRNPD